MWFMFALSFAVSSSLGGIVAKHVMKEMDEYAFLLFSGIFSAPFLLLIVLYYYQIPSVDITFFISLLVATSIGVVGALLAYRAIKISEISLVSPMSAFNPVFTAMIAFFALGETLTMRGVLGICLIVFGAYLMQIKEVKEGLLAPFKSLLKNKGVRYSLMAYFIWSVTPVFEKMAIRHTVPQVPPFASLVGMFMSMFAYAYLVRSKSEKVMFQVWKHLRFFVLVGLLGGVGQAAAFIAFSLTNLGYAIAVFKLSMIFTVIFGWVFFREKGIREKLLGSIVMLLGVILLTT